MQFAPCPVSSKMGFFGFCPVMGHQIVVILPIWAIRVAELVDDHAWLDAKILMQTFISIIFGKKF